MSYGQLLIILDQLTTKRSNYFLIITQTHDFYFQCHVSVTSTFRIDCLFLTLFLNFLYELSSSWEGKICVRVLTDNELKLHNQSHIGTVVGCSQADTVGYTAHPLHEYNLVWKSIIDWRAWVSVGRKQIPFHGPFVFRSS
jgi:hypothetical protein